MTNDPIATELAELRLRVERLERRIGADEHAIRPAPQPVAHTPSGPSSLLMDKVREREADARREPIPIHRDRRREPRADDAGAKTGVRDEPQRELSLESIERTIGARWYAVAGAIVVVMALGLFLKFAYDQGWLRVSAAMRCLGGGVFGIALVAAGEVLRRRLGALAGSGLYAAGIGCVYVSAFAAYRLHVIDHAGRAFALLAAVAIAGVLLASRVRLLMVAVASLLAGYLTPFLFVSAPPQPLVLPAYVLMLLGVGVGLSLRLGGPFQALRTLCWFGTIALGTFWTLRTGQSQPAFALAFLATVWAAVHAELLVSARRGFGATPHDGEDDRDLLALLISGELDRALRCLFAGRIRPYLSTFCTTAWAVSIGVFVARAWADPPDWLAPGAGAAACGVLGAVFAGGYRALLDRPRNDAQRLAACLVAQTGVLVLTTVTTACTGWVESVTYLALGLSVVVARRWLRMPAFTAFGLVALSIGTARVLLHDSWRIGLASGVERAGLVWSWWMMLALVTAAMWFAAAALLTPRLSHRPWVGVARVCAAVGAAVLLAAPVHRDAEPTTICLAWLATSVLFCAGRRLEPRLLLDAMGLCGLVLAAGAWVVAYPGEEWFASRAFPLLHPGLVVAGLLAAAALGESAWLARNPNVPRETAKFARTLAAVGAGVLMFAATSLEAARVAALLTSDPLTRGAVVSVWWGLVAIGLIGAGFGVVGGRVGARRGPPSTDAAGDAPPAPAKIPRAALGSTLRWVGLALLAVAAGKGLLVDIRGVHPLWRIGAVFALGMMMLAVHVVYSRIAGRSGPAAASGRGGASLARQADPAGP